MNTQDQAKLVVAIGATAVAAGAIATTAIVRKVRKHRICKPLPGTVRVAKLYVIKDTKKK